MDYQNTLEDLFKIHLLSNVNIIKFVKILSIPSICTYDTNPVGQNYRKCVQQSKLQKYMVNDFYTGPFRLFAIFQSICMFSFFELFCICYLI